MQATGEVAERGEEAARLVRVLAQPVIVAREKPEATSKAVAPIPHGVLLQVTLLLFLLQPRVCVPSIETDLRSSLASLCLP